MLNRFPFVNRHSRFLPEEFKTNKALTSLTVFRWLLRLAWSRVMYIRKIYKKYKLLFSLSTSVLSASYTKTNNLVTSRSQKRYILENPNFVKWEIYICSCKFVLTSSRHRKYFKSWFSFRHFTYNKYISKNPYLHIIFFTCYLHNVKL